jgi:hypothetical protein
MKQPANYLLVALISIGCIAFFAGIWMACRYTLNGDPGDMPTFISSLVTSIAAVLATNLGAVLGIAKTQPASPFRMAATWNPANLLSGDTASVIQTIACYIYIAGLLAAAIVWGKCGFKEDNSIVPLVEQLSKSLAGVVVGALAVSLNIQTTPTPLMPPPPPPPPPHKG